MQLFCQLLPRSGDPFLSIQSLIVKDACWSEFFIRIGRASMLTLQKRLTFKNNNIFISEDLIDEVKLFFSCKQHYCELLLYRTPSLPNSLTTKLPHYRTLSLPNSLTTKLPHYRTPSISNSLTTELPHYQTPSLPNSLTNTACGLQTYLLLYINILLNWYPF